MGSGKGTLTSGLLLWASRPSQTPLLPLQTCPIHQETDRQTEGDSQDSYCRHPTHLIPISHQHAYLIFQEGAILEMDLRQFLFE